MSKRKGAPTDEQPIDGPDAEALAARIRQERLYLGMSQADVATALDIPRAAVSALETGRRRVSGLELKGLAQLFGTSVDRLLGDVAPEDPATAALFRATKDLSVDNKNQVLRFAEFLRTAGAAPTVTMPEDVSE